MYNNINRYYQKMKIFSIMFMHYVSTMQVPIMLYNYHNIENVSIFNRNSAKEIYIFIGREITKRACADESQCIHYNEYICCYKITPKNLAIVVLTDEEYPKRVSFDFIEKALKIFVTKIPEKEWIYDMKDKPINIPEITNLLSEYQNPTNVDKISKIKNELNEVKEIIIKSLDQLLERGQKLDDVIEKSQDLSFKSKIFLKRSKDLNKCCTVL